MAKKIATEVLKVKEIGLKGTEGAGQEWEKQHRAVYIGSIDGLISVKLVLESKTPEQLEKYIAPRPKQQFDMTLRDVGADSKLSEFEKNAGGETKQETKQLGAGKEPIVIHPVIQEEEDLVGSESE